MTLPVRELPRSSAMFRLTFKKLFSAGFRRRTRILMALVSLVFLFPSLNIATAWSDTDRPSALRDVAFDQKLNTQIPLDLAFLNETGKSVRLGDYFREKTGYPGFRLLRLSGPLPSGSGELGKDAPCSLLQRGKTVRGYHREL